MRRRFGAPGRLALLALCGSALASNACMRFGYDLIGGDEGSTRQGSLGGVGGASGAPNAMDGSVGDLAGTTADGSGGSGASPTSTGSRAVGGMGGTSGGGASGTTGRITGGGGTGGGLGSGGVTGGMGGASGTSASGGVGGAGATSGTSGSGGVGSGGTSTAASSGGTGGSGGVSLPSDCNGYPGANQFTFDSNTQGWIINAQQVFPMDLTWQAMGGSPTASGVLRVNTTPGADAAYLNLPMSATDLSGAIVSARVFIAAGTDVGLKLYMQSGASYAWIDGGRVVPPGGQWACISLDISAPSAVDADFDATQVVEVGIDIIGTGDITLFVDDIRY